MKNVTETNGRLTAQELAARYHYELVDLKGIHLDLELFRTIPVDLMFRYNFVPLRTEGNALVIAMVDPSDLVMVDEVAALLGSVEKIRVVAAHAGRGDRRLQTGSDPRG
jgi:hypothetical protein